MAGSLALEALTAEQRGLWDRVSELWELSRRGDRTLIGAGIHPRYVGWDMSTELPHDKNAAIASVTENAPRLTSYVLSPHSVQTYDHAVGVVHYSYRATVEPRAAPALDVTGKWTEVYLRQHDEWQLIAVGGRPDAPLRTQPHAG